MEVSWERSDPSDSVSEGETELETCTHVLQVDDEEDEEERNQNKHSADQQSQEFSASGELACLSPEQECLSANPDKLNYEEKDATPDTKDAEAKARWRSNSKRKLLVFHNLKFSNSLVGKFKKMSGWSCTWDEQALKSCGEEIIRRVVLIQSRFRALRARKLRKKLLIAHELYNTEKNYVQALSVAVNVFYFPLLMMQERKQQPSDQPFFETKDEIDAIFSVIDKLHVYHTQFLEILKERILDWEVFEAKSLGDIFLEKTNFFELYRIYINNYDHSIRTLNYCKDEVPNFEKFIIQCEAKEECGLHDLPSFLIQPIQRIPRYAMMLADLMRKTSKWHVTYAQLSKAVKKMKDLISFFNEQKRDAENADYVEKLYASFVVPDSSHVNKRKSINFNMNSPRSIQNEISSKMATMSLESIKTRRFIKEGDVLLVEKQENSKTSKKKKEKDMKKSKERHMILFNDLLVLCKVPPSIAANRTNYGRVRSNTAPIPTRESLPSLRRNNTTDQIAPPESPRRLHGATIPPRNKTIQALDGAAVRIGTVRIRESAVTSLASSASSLHHQIPPQYQIKEIEDLWKVQAVVGLPESYGPAVFQIKSFRQSYLISVKSPKEKEEWMQTLHSTKEALYQEMLKKLSDSALGTKIREGCVWVVRGTRKGAPQYSKEKRRSNYRVAAAVVCAGLLIGGAKVVAYNELQVKPHRERMAYLNARKQAISQQSLTDEEKRADAATQHYITPEEKRMIRNKFAQLEREDRGHS